jgi:hypothetical protein
MKRLCRNSKRALLKPVFGGVLPLNFKNNSLQANLRGAVFAENNYDTASKRVALFYSQRPLNKGSTKVLMFPFAPLCKVLGFQAKQ